MALATQCPHCHTKFRVAADQLKLRGGIVRCGSCQTIFDGNAHLIDLDGPVTVMAPPEPPPAPPPAPVAAPESEPQEDDVPVYTIDFGHTFDPVGILPQPVPDDARIEPRFDLAGAAPPPAPAEAEPPVTFAPAGRIEPSFGPVESEPEPEPEPMPEPEPEPEPPPEPAPAPAVDPAHGLPSAFFAYVEQEVVPDAEPPEVTRRSVRAPWPELHFDAEPQPAPQPAPEPEPQPAPQPEPAPVPEPAVPAEPVPEPQAAVEPEPEPAPEPAPEPLPEPVPEPAFEPAFEPEPVGATEPSPDAVDADDAAPPAALPLRASADADGPVTEMPPADASAPQRSARAKAREARARRSKLTPTPIDETPRLRVPETDEPEFVKRSRRQERSGRMRRIGMGVGSALLLLLLAAQGVLEFRNVLAARYPGMAPLLSAACVPLGCRVGLPAQVDNLAIETGELSPLGPDTYSLNTLLRNQGTLVQAWPSIELELVDDNNKALLRRVFGPADYLPPATIATGFAGRAEQPVRLDFTLAGIKPAGYHVFVFYP